MEGEDSPENSPGGGRSGKGKRGVIWGASETAALIKIWGQAERKYALSSRKRNYEIYERIASELGKSGYKRTAEECRSKTKLLRKLYKAAARQDDNNNNTPGAPARSKFLWMEEMDQIFRPEASIRPLRTTGSEAATRQVADTDMDSGEVFSHELYKVKDYVPKSPAASDSSIADTQMTDGGEASFSGQSAPAHPSGRQQDRGRTADVRETCNPEATLDPPTRDMIRKRKQRATAAAQLDRTLTGFVDWVKQDSRRKEKLLREAYAEQKHFHHEVIANMRIASSCLQQLTEYMTGASGSCTRNGRPRPPCRKNLLPGQDQEKQGPCRGSPNRVHTTPRKNEGDNNGKGHLPNISSPGTDTDEGGFCSESPLDDLPVGLSLLPPLNSGDLGVQVTHTKTSAFDV